MVSRSDVTFTFSKIEDVEFAARTLLEASSEMDWWLYAAWSMILERCDDKAKTHPLSVAGAWTQMMVAHISSMLWANTILKLHAALVKVNSNLTFDALQCSPAVPTCLHLQGCREVQLHIP